jgi:hypothetical protein
MRIKLRLIKTWDSTTTRDHLSETLSIFLQRHFRIVVRHASILSTMSDSEDDSFSDSEIGDYGNAGNEEEDFHNHHFDYNDSESDDHDCDCDECVAHHGTDDDDDDDDDERASFTPASSVPRLCAQLRTNDPSVLPHGPYELFQPDVPDFCRLAIAKALAQNTVVRRIFLERKHYGTLSADAWPSIWHRASTCWMWN